MCVRWFSFSTGWIFRFQRLVFGRVIFFRIHKRNGGPGLTGVRPVARLQHGFVPQAWNMRTEEHSDNMKKNMKNDVCSGQGITCPFFVRLPICAMSPVQLCRFECWPRKPARFVLKILRRLERLWALMVNSTGDTTSRCRHGGSPMGPPLPRCCVAEWQVDLTSHDGTKILVMGLCGCLEIAWQEFQKQELVQKWCVSRWFLSSKLGDKVKCPTRGLGLNMLNFTPLFAF